jgi:hypothetical protein
MWQHKDHPDWSISAIQLVSPIHHRGYLHLPGSWLVVIHFNDNEHPPYQIVYPDEKFHEDFVEVNT